MDFDVFISYSSNDKVVVEAICAFLEQRKIRCWYADRDIPAGEDWAENIIEALDHAKIFVLVFTDFSNASKQVLREVNNAVSNGLPIIPFKLTQNAPSGGMRYYLSTVHWLDAMNSELEKSITDLCAVVEAIMKSGDDSIDTTSDKVKPYIPESKAESWYKKRLKKLIIGCSIALVIIAGAAIAIPQLTMDNRPRYDTVTSVVQPLDLAAIEESESTVAMGRYCAYDGERIYYRSNDGWVMYSSLPDGSNPEKLTDEAVKEITSYGEYVYYISASEETAIRRIQKADGTIETIYKGYIDNLQISGDRIYYLDGLDGRRLYSMTLDGLDRRCVRRTKSLSDYIVFDNMLIFADPDDGNKLYRSDLSGGEAELIKDTSAKDMVMIGSYIVYNDLMFNRIYAIDAVTLEEYEVASGRLDDMCIAQGTLFGLDNVSKYLCSIPNGQHTTSVLADIPALSLSANGESIYLISKDTSTAYLYSLSGELIKEL